MDVTNKPHGFSLGVYLLLAYGITWLCWLPGLIIGSQRGYVMPNFDTYAALFEAGFEDAQHLILGITFSLGVYGPLIGALVASWMDGGRGGLVDLWDRITRWRIAGRWYLIAVVIILLVTGLPVGILGLATGFKPSELALWMIPFGLVAQLLTSGLGEEPGWRGFLLPRLSARYEGERVIWMVGLIWAIWHYPLVIVQTMSVMQDVTFLQTSITIIVQLAGMTMSQIGMTFIYAWLYSQTESVFLLIVFHALSNLFSSWLLTFLEAPQAATIFLALMPWAVVIYLRRRLGKAVFLSMGFTEIKDSPRSRILRS
jgi:membrane protease YdiL (CAAX protease family)